MNCENIFTNANEIKLRNQLEGNRIDINMIMKVESKKYGKQLLLYNKKHNKKFFANALLKAYLDKMLSDLKSKDIYFYKDDDMSTILTFKIASITTDEKGTHIQIDFMKKKKESDINEVLPLDDGDY